jgi:hypothetical protein
MQDVTDLLLHVATARRTLQIARDAQSRLSHFRSYDGAVLALVANVATAEHNLADAIEKAGGQISDGETVLTCEYSDRRSTPRPQFIVHKIGEQPKGRRDAFAA